MGGLIALLIALASAFWASSRSQAIDNSEGFITSRIPMLLSVAPEVTVQPLLTVGDTLPNGYSYAARPDGIAVRSDGEKGVEVFVSHETATLPFGGADFENGRLSRLLLDQSDGVVRGGEIVIDSTANFVRFCAIFLARAIHGFDNPLLFLNEESNATVSRSGRLWPPASASEAEDAGLVVVYDPALDAYRPLPGMGRINHENSVALPGYSRIAILTTDDDGNKGNSQLYLYLAENRDAVWDDRGSLYAFKADPGYPDQYESLDPDQKITGSFIKVPRPIADGTAAAPGQEQELLESWSDRNGVFEFMKLEDLAYDRSNPRFVYLTDSAGTPEAPNGRIFKMVLDPGDPRIVRELSVLIDGDAYPAGDLAAIHNPDNLETTPNSLMIQEDPGRFNRYPIYHLAGTNARIWRYDLKTGQLTVVAMVNQGAYDPFAAQGSWESTGIVDASAYFGPGSFLVNVQAHSISTEIAVGEQMDALTGQPVILRREGGQLLLLRVPDS